MNDTSTSNNEGGHVQFRMTVKVDIEGTVPSSSDAQSASASGSATNATPDLLLKLQPLLPHLCIRQESTISNETGISAATTLSTSMSSGEEPPAGDDSSLELSLGLSLGSPVFKSRALPLGGGGAQQQQETQGSGSVNTELLRAWHEKGDTLVATSTSFAPLQERSHLGQQQQMPPTSVLQRQPSNAAAAGAVPLPRSDSLGGGGGGGGGAAAAAGFEWRQQQRELVLEHQRMKRDAQSQRRQEARKKRRILIDEQKQHRKSAASKASACPSSAAPMQARVVKPTPQKKASHQAAAAAAAMENRESSPGNADASGDCGGGDGELEDFRSVVRAERDRALMDKRTKTSDSSAAAASKVKVEQEEPPDSAGGSGGGGGGVGGGVIRPSPVHESSHQWVHKFLEMQKMVKSSSVAAMDTLPPCENAAAGSPSRYEDEDEQQGGDGDELSKESSLEQQQNASSSAAAMDSQSLEAHPAAVTTSMMMPPPPCSSSAEQVPFQDKPVKQEDHVPRSSSAASSLFRSASMGSFGIIGDEHSVKLPSPIRSSLQQQHSGGLLRTLSLDGASTSAFTSVVAANNEQPQSSRGIMPPPCMVNIRTENSAFKSPKKEPALVNRAKPFAVPASTSSGTDKNRMITRRNSTGGGADAVQDCGGAAGGATIAIPGAAAPAAASMSLQGFPWVSTTGTGPNGKTVSGVLFAYQKGDVKIVCACHGQHMTAREFVEHAGGVDVANPEKCIKVNPFMLSPSKSLPATTKCTS